MTTEDHAGRVAAAAYNSAHSIATRAGIKLDIEPVALPPAPQANSIEIYDTGLLMRRLGYRDDGFVGDPAEITTDDDAGHQRQLRIWRRMLQDPRGAWRHLVIPDASLVARLVGLDDICPSFAEVTGWIVRAARLAMATGTPLRLDPCAIVGPPGTGKTFYTRKLAEALSVPCEVIAMNLVTDRGSAFSGLTPVWRGACPGKPAKLLLDHDYASPLIVIDEIEKASPLNPRETPEMVLHSLLEVENAARFVDEFIDIPIRADAVFWFATANSLDPLPASIIDRLIVFCVEPKPHEMLSIQKSIFAGANLRLGRHFCEPAEELFRAASKHTPRTLSRLWTIAMAFACDQGRRTLEVQDIRRAEAVLLAGRCGVEKQIGFLADHRG